MMKYSLSALTLAALLLSGCGNKAAEEETTAEDTQAAAPAPEAASERRISVSTLTTTPEDVSILLEAVGEVQSLEAPTVGAEVGGRVTRIMAEVGDVVAQGDVLATIDKTGIDLELDVARAEQGRVQALVENQAMDLKRLQDLKKNSFVSTSDIDKAEAQMRVLKEELAVARARVALARDKLSKTTVKAPVSGKVDIRLISEGDYVKDGDPLFTLTNTEALRMAMVFPEPALPRLKIGTPLRFVTAVDPERVLQARITELRPMVETANKGVVAYADLPEPQLTRAGASAGVKAVVAVHKDAIVLPLLSVVRRPAGEVVYVVGEDGRVAERKVKTGVRVEKRIEVVEGLEHGEQVVVDGAGFLTDGAAVDVKQP